LDGPLSTYQQHCRGLAKLDRSECPRQAILQDLEVAVAAWQDAGDEIIVLTDFDDDVQLPWIRNFFGQMNLVKAISELTGLLPTATHNRGSTPIDGIYVSTGLLPSITGGYLAFDVAIPSDHRALWVDIPRTILGFNEEYRLHKSTARHLQCRDPRVVTKYVSHLTSKLDQANAFQRVAQLGSSISRHHLTREYQQEYEELD